MARRVYIAGPMRGHALLNFPAFDHAARCIRLAGHIAVSPAELDRARGFDETLYPSAESTSVLDVDNVELKDIIRIDVQHLLMCDDIVMLDWWRSSSGACAEYAVAEWAGIDRHSLDGWMAMYA